MPSLELTRRVAVPFSVVEPIIDVYDCAYNMTVIVDSDIYAQVDLEPLFSTTVEYVIGGE